MRHLVLILALVACAPAEAGPTHGPKHGPAMVYSGGRGGSSGEGSLGAATYGRTWDLAFDGRNCVNGAFNTWSDQTALGVNMALDATDTDYSCDFSTTGLNAAGIGSALVDKGVQVAATTAACWSDASPTGFPTIGDNDDFILRLIVRSIADPTSPNVFFDWNPGGSEFIYVEQTSGDTYRARADEAGGAAYISGVTGVASRPAWHIVDAFYEAIGTTNPVWTICLDGTCSTSTEHTGLHGIFGPSGRVSMAGDATAPCGQNMVNGVILFVGLAIGANATFWGEAAHDADCQATGICP